MSLETNITQTVQQIGLDIKALRNNSSSSSSISNIEEFEDETYIYFLFDVSTGGFQVNRYENSTTKTVATGTTRPTTLIEVQSLTYS